jgi:hypothetical protein
MRKETQQMAQRLKRITWFARLGQYEGAEYARVKSKVQAIKSLTSRKWFDFVNPILNHQMSEVVPRFNHVDEYNALAEDVSGKATDAILECIGGTIDERLGLELKIKNALRMDISGILWETEFVQFIAPIYYCPLILPVYEMGHLPCGWEGKSPPIGWTGFGPQDLPRGRLRVY